MEMSEEMKEEWNELMSDMRKMDGMMKGMEGMEEMKMEWDKMMESAKKMQDMMEKGM